MIDAARRWAGVWERAWAAKDVEAIVALYSDSARYRALVLREPELGVAGVRAYLQRTLGEEDAVDCHFGEPVASGDRAAVEWWASWTEDGHELTMAGATILRLDADGMVVDHRDYWNQLDRREPPFDGGVTVTSATSCASRSVQLTSTPRPGTNEERELSSGDGHPMTSIR